MNIFKKPEIMDAIISLRPGAHFAMNGEEYSGIIWYDQEQTQPTEDEVNAKLTVLQAAYEANEYKRKRLPHAHNTSGNTYPSISDQLDMLWHSMHNDEIPKAEAFYNAILNVKNTHPKS
jgi:hypothetical protein